MMGTARRGRRLSVWVAILTWYTAVAGTHARDAFGQVTVSRAAVSVVAVGPRYLAVTPAVGDTLVALKVTSPDWPCLSRYVGADGVLQSSPDFQAPTAWGTVYARGSDIVADTPYDVQTDDGMTLSARARTWHWADATHDGFANVADVLCILDRFSVPIPALR